MSLGFLLSFYLLFDDQGQVLLLGEHLPLLCGLSLLASEHFSLSLSYFFPSALIFLHIPFYRMGI